MRCLVARSGVGLVLEAREPDLNRSVAIKMLATALAASRSAGERFVREARAAAALEHLNIMPICTVKQGHPLPYLVMPFIQGVTLAERIERGPEFTADEMIAITEKVVKGLAFAYREGVIHRDIKPTNILLDSASDGVLLADFGLARVASEQSDTASGVVSGTPQYMAPEQATQGEVIPGVICLALGRRRITWPAGSLRFRGRPWSVSCNRSRNRNTQRSRSAMRHCHPGLPPRLTVC